MANKYKEKFVGSYGKVSTLGHTSPDDLLGTGRQFPKGTKIKKVGTGYIPRPLQQKLHEQLKRFNVLVCHRRFGKTVFAINELLDQALRNPMRNPQYAYIAPTYKQAKKIAWKYLKDYTRRIPGAFPNKSELTVYIQRPNHIDPITGEKDPDEIAIMLIGADDPDSLRGLYLDGAILDEYAQCDPIIWGEIVRPALGDRGKIRKELMREITDKALRKKFALVRSPWAIFIGTPKGQNHFYDRYMKAMSAEQTVRKYEEEYKVLERKEHFAEIDRKLGIDDDTPQIQVTRKLSELSKDDQQEYKDYRRYLAALNWFTSIYKTSETGILGREEVEEMSEDLTEEQVQQELECSFTAAILGSYYGHIINKMYDDQRITKVPYDPRYPVDTFWDIGVGDKTAIWFRQLVGPFWHYIDYYEYNGEGVEWYSRVLQAKAGGKGTKVDLDEKNRVEGEGYRYGRHVWPHDGNQKEFGTGNSKQATARKHGLIVEIQEKSANSTQIDAARNRLKVAFIDEEKCARGITCLYNFQKEWDSKKKMFKQEYLHDWSSHGSKAFHYSAIDERTSSFSENRGKGLQTKANMEYNELDY